jgi:hypothetical protein
MSAHVPSPRPATARAHTVTAGEGRKHAKPHKDFEAWCQDAMAGSRSFPVESRGPVAYLAPSGRSLVVTSTVTRT